jgi:hypothetical protein
MLTAEEAANFPRAVMQGVWRGCADEAEINNFIRIIVARYITQEHGLSRMVMVQQMRHKIVTNHATETVIVAYATGPKARTDVNEGMERIGLLRMQESKRVTYVGLNFEVVRSGMYVTGPLPAYVFEDKNHIILSAVWEKLTYQEVTDALVTIIDVRDIEYWIVRAPFMGRMRSVVIGLRSEIIPRIADDDGLKALLNVKMRWRADVDHLPFREGRDDKTQLRGTMVEINSQGVLSGVTSTSTQPQVRPLPPVGSRTYAAAVNVDPPKEEHQALLTMTAMQTTVAAMQQFLQNQDDRIKKTEQQLTQQTQQTAVLNGRFETLAAECKSTNEGLKRLEDNVVSRILASLNGLTRAISRDEPNG